MAGHHTNYPATRAGFQALDSEFGSFTLKKDEPWDTDTAFIGNHDFILTFSNFVPVDTVMTRLKLIPQAYSAFHGDTSAFAGVDSLREQHSPYSLRLVSANDRVYLTGEHLDQITLWSCLGKNYSASIQQEEGMCFISVSNLPRGLYFIVYSQSISRILVER